MTTSLVHTEDVNGVRVLRLTNGRRNPLSARLMADLLAALTEADAEPSLAGIVLTGAGDAVGGGGTIILTADLRIAADTARFGYGFTRIGVTPEGGSTWLLPRLVGLSRATDWLLTGRVLTAADALAAGLVSQVVPVADLLDVAIGQARDIGTRSSPAARRLVRDLLDAGGLGDFDTSRRLESDALRTIASTRDAREGIAAFAQRRPARFTPLPPARST